MTDHPITPNRLREYAETRGDTLEGLRVDERAFIEACAWEWEKAREAKPTPAAPEKPACEHEWGAKILGDDSFVKWCGKCGQEQPVGLSMGSAMSLSKPAPSSPAAERLGDNDSWTGPVTAAERADEGRKHPIPTIRNALDRIHRRACGETTDTYMSIPADPERDADLILSAAIDELEAARALRRGGVTEAMRKVILYMADLRRVRTYEEQLSDDEIRAALKDMDALNSGASVVVDREEWERTKADLERLRAFYRSVNDEIPEGLWPAATTLDAFRKLVDGYANVCADAKALHEREDERDRALADTEHRHALAERERDALAAKLAEAEKERDARIRELVLVGNERSVTEAHLATARAEAERLRSMSTVEMMGENLNVKHHVEEWEARCLKAEADAGRLRSERALIAKALDAEFSSEPLWSVAERLRGERDGLRALGVREAEKNATPFVVDREKVARVLIAAWHRSIDGGEPAWDTLPEFVRKGSFAEADAAIAEYERQRAEWEAGK